MVGHSSKPHLAHPTRSGVSCLPCGHHTKASLPVSDPLARGLWLGGTTAMLGTKPRLSLWQRCAQLKARCKCSALHAVLQRVVWEGEREGLFQSEPAPLLEQASGGHCWLPTAASDESSGRISCGDDAAFSSSEYTSASHDTPPHTAIHTHPLTHPGSGSAAWSAHHMDAHSHTAVCASTGASITRTSMTVP